MSPDLDSRLLRLTAASMNELTTASMNELAAASMNELRAASMNELRAADVPSMVLVSVLTIHSQCECTIVEMLASNTF